MKAHKFDNSNVIEALEKMLEMAKKGDAIGFCGVVFQAEGDIQFATYVVKEIPGIQIVGALQALLFRHTARLGTMVMSPGHTTPQEITQEELEATMIAAKMAKESGGTH